MITLQQLTKNPRTIRSTDVVKDVNRIPDELLEARTVQELIFVESLGEEVVDVNMEVAVNVVETLSSDRLFRDGEDSLPVGKSVNILEKSQYSLVLPNIRYMIFSHRLSF